MKPEILEIGERDGWTRRVDGFVKGNVGIFPFFLGSWGVWRKTNGNWHEINHPDAFVSSTGMTRGLAGWHVCWEKTQEQVIIEAKALAERWK